MIARLWLVGGSIVTVLVLAWGSFEAVDLLARHQDEVGVDVGAEGVERLVVEVASGRVEIVGEETDRIGLAGTVTSGIVSTPHRESIAGRQFVVSSECPFPMSSHCGVDYRIVVPRDLEVVVQGGQPGVELDALSGSVEVTTSDNAIHASRLSGDVRLRTSNSSVTADELSASHVEARTSNDAVQLGFMAPPRRVDVHTSNDRVEVVVPDTDDAYRVDLETSNGERVADVRTDPDSDRVIRVRTSNDNVRVTYPAG